MDDYLDKVEAQLAQLTERGAHRRLRVRMTAGAPLGRGARGAGGAGGAPSGPRLRSEALAVAAALVVALAVVAVVLGVNHASRASHPASHRTTQHSRPAVKSRPSRSTRHTPAPAATNPATQVIVGPRGGPVPAAFVPRSFTAISELTWWLLGSAPCASPPCTSIVRTTDGGGTFVGIPAPRSALAGSPSQPGVTDVRFADRLNGFAFGGSLYVTHDGGASWHPVELGGGSVTALAISAGEVYGIVSPQGGAPGRLMRSPVGADSWITLRAPGGVSYGLWARGRDVLVQSASAKNVLLVSRDSGATFAQYPSPSVGLPCDFEEPAPGTIWAHCATGTMSGVWRSVDSGRSFRQASFCNCPPRANLALVNSAAFAAASASTAVVGSQQLYRTADGGASYAADGPRGLIWQYLGFTDLTHGVGLALPSSSSAAAEGLYYTTDAGASYHAVPIR
jgi:photosystem II stability/assembly factor-like uncharacterized protein